MVQNIQSSYFLETNTLFKVCFFDKKSILPNMCWILKT